jgi:hypothetical protein
MSHARCVCFGHGSFDLWIHYERKRKHWTTNGLMVVVVVVMVAVVVVGL